MSKEKSSLGIRSGESVSSMADGVTERRERLSHLIGRMLARNWLQRRQTEKGKSDSPDDGSA